VRLSVKGRYSDTGSDPMETSLEGVKTTQNDRPAATGLFVSQRDNRIYSGCPQRRDKHGEH
jgi:hypothetical protein